MIAKDSLNNDVPSREVRAIRLKRFEMRWLVSFSGTKRQRRASIVSLLTSKRWWVYFVLSIRRRIRVNTIAKKMFIRAEAKDLFLQR
jgi:hypothetical protein